MGEARFFFKAPLMQRKRLTKQGKNISQSISEAFRNHLEGMSKGKMAMMFLKKSYKRSKNVF